MSLVFRLALAALAGAIVPSAAEAAFITTSGASGGATSYPPGSPPLIGTFEDYWNYGATSSSASGSALSSYGSASVSLLSNPGIRLTAVAGNQFSEVIVAANWLDTIRAGGVPPARLRVTVEVEGDLALAAGDSFHGSGSGRIGIVQGNSFADPPDPLSYRTTPPPTTGPTTRPRCW